MQPMLSNLYSSETLMAGHGFVRDKDDRDDRGLGTGGGRSAADDDLLRELNRLQAGAPTKHTQSTGLLRLCG